ncbi:MAG TPA: acyl-ACP--UDP-N-acetylglucosamine O-acyltransferase [Stellaceae bacterium]|nr:acyl-ACP--UDP-N-acetylglucosamine O-acyltransferase [Stellaceae bacterium]
MATIHPTAIIEPGAELGPNVRIGPYCHVGPRVVLDDAVELLSHVAVAGITRIGARTRIFPFVSIGHQPQDLKYQGEESRLEIGADNIIREYVTMNPGTRGGGMLTQVGDKCLFMASAHVAHDCHVGDHVIMANNATLAGHITIGDYAFLGGLSAVHQFVRIGAHAMIGGITGVERDVIPYGMVVGDRARLTGLNIVGLQRRGFSRDEIQALRTAYQMIFGEELGTLVERVNEAAERFPDVRPVQDVIAFIRADSSRGLVQAKAANGG